PSRSDGTISGFSAPASHRLGHRPSGGNEDPTGYLPVGFPEGHLAGKERVIRRWLDVAVDVEGPRSDPVLARQGSPPSDSPEPPCEASLLFPARQTAEECCRHPRSVVNSDLDGRDWCAPRSTPDFVLAAVTRDFGRC